LICAAEEGNGHQRLGKSLESQPKAKRPSQLPGKVAKGKEMPDKGKTGGKNEVYIASITFSNVKVR